MKAIIEPSRARGTVAAPPSKSMAHRLLICAGLSKGKSIVRKIAPSQDVLATLDCLGALGADYKYENETVTIYGADLSNVKDGTVLPCRECGSTLRFFIPIALLTGKEMIFTGSETLLNRPLGVYEDICKKEGFLFRKGASELRVQGSLKSGEYELPGDISSQFISGLLFALPKTGGASIIKIIPPIESRPYIDMTIGALREFNIDVQPIENNLIIKGVQEYTAQDTEVEGDYSNAAFLDALNLAGGRVNVTGLNADSLQGDRVYAEFFEMIESGTPTIDISNCPDLGPILMAAAAIKNGAVLTGTRRLRIKESDRAEAMKRELEKFGVEVSAGEDDIRIASGSLKRPDEELFGHNDHRIVMALSVLSSITGGVIEGAQAVRKSFPDFFDKLRELNIEVHTDGMDK